MAEKYGTTPAALLNLEDPWVAYCLNEATYLWSMHVESQLIQATKGSQNEALARMARKGALNLLMQPFPKEWDQTETAPEQMTLEDPMEPKPLTPKSGQYRDPANLFKAKGN